VRMPGFRYPSDVASALARRVSGVVDASVRVAYIKQTLRELGAAQSAEVLSIVAAHVEARDPEFERLLLAITVALAEQDAAELKREVVDEAIDRGFEEVARMLIGRLDSDELEDDELPVPDFGLGRPLTLGERKAIARKNDRDLIARVLRDPHPDVIRILLGNPCVTEDDIVRLCARRPVSVEVLREISRSTKWVVRYRVKLALVKNPLTPLEVGLQLAPHLARQHAREISDSPELDQALRDACLQRLRRRTTLH